MKFKRITALVLSVAIFFTLPINGVADGLLSPDGSTVTDETMNKQEEFSIPLSESDEVFDAPIVIEDKIIPASEDTYVVSGRRWNLKNYGNYSTMLFGKTYDRTAYIKFDISGVDISVYEGALLELTFDTASASGNIEVYTVSSDWNEKDLNRNNANMEYDFVVSAPCTGTGTQKIEMTLNSALQKAKENGENEISVVLKSDQSCVSAMTSEAMDESVRPKLILTKESAYVSGQYDFKYPEVTHDQLKAELTKMISKGHPYIYASKEDFERIKKNAFGKDPLTTKIYQNIKEDSEAKLSQVPYKVVGNISNSSYMSTSFAMLAAVLNFSFLYNIEGDIRFAEGAWKQAEYILSMENWGTFQYIDNVQTAFAIAIAYDWLYDWLSDEQKQLLISGLRSKHLDTMNDLYNNRSRQQYQETFYWQVFSSNNHAILDNAFTFICAMAIAEDDIDLHCDTMVNALNRLENPWNHWFPDGGWYEGIGYWNFAGVYTERVLYAMYNAFGHCFGYEDLPHIKKVVDYPIYGQSNLGGMMWSDIDPFISARSSAIYNYGVLLEDLSIMKWTLDNVNLEESKDVEFLVAYDPSIDYDKVKDVELDKLFRNTDQVTLRDTFNGNQETFVGMAAQSGAKSVGHLASGTIGIDALGERWIANHGKELYYASYAGGVASGTRWHFYRARAEANGCIVINPSAEPDQDPYSTDKIEKVFSGPGSAYSYIDLSNTYYDMVKSYVRGVALANNRKTVVIQDELVLTEPSEVYSFFNVYLGKIEISKDKKSAIITKHNKKMYVTIDCDQEYELYTMASEPLPTSPVPPDSNMYNPEHTKLVLHFDKIDNANIRVTFTPYLVNEEIESMPLETFVPISQWKVEETVKEVPKLEGIMINGVELAEFNPYNRCYVVPGDKLPDSVTAVVDPSRYDVEVRKDSKEISYEIVVTDKKDSSNINSYSVAIPYVEEPSYVDTTGMSVLNIEKISAPVHQAQNGIENIEDGDLNTRWSTEGVGIEMMLTLDRVKDIGCLAMAIMDGSNGRKQYFSVQLSEDGMNWTPKESFMGAGVTDDFEYYDMKNQRAKYIKITFNACNQASWNSVTELKVYGK